MSELSTKLFINGVERPSSDGAGLPQINPATEEIFCEVSAAGAGDVEAAVEGAQRTFVSGWRDLVPGRRTEILFNIARLIRENWHGLLPG